ncbi:MAG TPA: hypothetical protein VII55_03070 [Candidatus Saccharimonadales bacterium]
MILQTSKQLYEAYVADRPEPEHELSPEEAEALRDVTGRTGSEDDTLACELESIDLALLKVEHGGKPQLLSGVYEGALSTQALSALVAARNALSPKPGPAPAV